jgi:tryptophan synthase alpha chain
MKKRISIAEKFNELAEKKECAFIVYLTAGYPSLDESVAHLESFARAGADIIEIGIPFSDPVADGLTIQYSSEIALRNGVRLSSILERLQYISVEVPLVIMSYLNPILAYGTERFIHDCKHVGIAGVVIPDLPVEESVEWKKTAVRHDIETIFMVTPTTPKARIASIAQVSGGFIYYVSVSGTTGVRYQLPEISNQLDKIRGITNTPIAVGFGIFTPAQVKAVCRHADGVIVGSRIIEATRNNENVCALISALKEATRG